MTEAHAHRRRSTALRLTSRSSRSLTACASLYALTSTLTCALIGPSPERACAQETETALQRAAAEYKLGVTHFKAGEYDQALLYFIRVHRVSPNPNLVYNIARAFEELQQVKEAADYYEEYLRLSPDSSDRRQVELTIKALRGVQQSRSQKGTAASEPTTSGSTVSDVTEHTSDSVVAPTDPQADPQVDPSRAHTTTAPTLAQESARNKGGARDTLSWISLGAGALAVGGGLYFGLEASHQDELTASASTLAAARAARDARTSAAAWADGLYVGGAALVGVGLYLLITRPAASSASVSATAPATAPASPSVALSPTSFSLTWSF